MKPVHVLLAVLVAAVWGANFVVIDVGLRDFPPLLFSALRFTIAALPAVFFIGRPRVPWRWVLAVSLTLGILKFGVLFVGMHLGMPAGLASLVLQGQAVFTLVFAGLLLRERPRRIQVAGMAIAASGIVLAGTESGTATVVGFLLAVVAAAFWGLSNVAMRKAKPQDTFRFMVWVSVFPPIPLALVSMLVEGGQQDLAALRELTPSGVGAVLYVAWAATLFGYAVWGRLLRTYDAATVAPFSLLVPVFGLFSAWLVLDEPVTAVTVGAAALVVCGIGAGMLRPGGKAGSAAGPPAAPAAVTAAAAAGATGETAAQPQRPGGPGGG